MKKKISKITSLVFAAVLMIGVFCACSSKASYAGTWYNSYDLEDDPLILTKDGTFSLGGVGGEYTIDDGKIILTASFMSDVGEIDEVNGETVIIDSEGEIWFKGKDKAQSYADAKYKEEAEALLAEIERKGDFIGTYSNFDDYNFDYYLLDICEDHTYTYAYKKDVTYNSISSKSAEAAQVGTWSLRCDGSMGNVWICLDLSPQQSEGYDEFRDDSWIAENTLPIGLNDMWIPSDYDDTIYSKDAIDNVWVKINE